MTAVPAPGAASSWRRISTGDDTVAVAERAALGTTAQLAVWPLESHGAALGAVDSVLSALDRQASRFREDSEIGWIHRSRGGRFMLSNGLAEAVSVALEAARWTGGLVDPTVGAALISLGYDRDFAAIDPERGGPAGAPVPAPGWQTVRLDGPMLTLPASVRLDLGATAKGLGSDRAAKAVMNAAGQAGGVLVSLGGDIAVAGQSPRNGWPILVADRPEDPASSLTQNVRLAGRRWRPHQCLAVGNAQHRQPQAPCWADRRSTAAVAAGPVAGPAPPAWRSTLPGTACSGPPT